eukprot:Em0022g923a
MTVSSKPLVLVMHFATSMFSSPQSSLLGSDDYGVDEGHSANPFDEGSVSVPTVPNQLNHDQLQYLALQHDPLKPSNSTVLTSTWLSKKKLNG